VTVPDYDDSLFRGTAAYYASFRPQLPAELVHRIAHEARLDGTGRLLDVGCGTGQVLTALGDRFESSVGIDADPEMLAEAQRSVAAVGLQDRVVFREGRAPEQLPMALGPFRLVTFSRVFHWLDGDATAGAVLRLLEPGGSISIFGDGSFWTGDEDWQKVIRAVLQKWLGVRRRAGAAAYREPDETFDSVLRKAGFADVRTSETLDERLWTIDAVIGYLYSTSFAGRDQFGGDHVAFETDLRSRLLAFNPAGSYRERAKWGMWIAERPPEE
jgi:ubiquinone/menaquinone biosynthesis C-methylase UbiE